LGRQLHLKPNVRFEPLLDTCLAWTHLLAPHTAARNLSDGYLPLLRARLYQRPERPAEESGWSAEAACELYHGIRRRCASLLELAGALSAAADLVAQVNGCGPLEPLYARMPAAVRGFVEVAYDLDHRPSLRVLEPLLYRSRYFDRTLQGVIMVDSPSAMRDALFFPPARCASHGLYLPLPLESPLLDELARLRTEPRTLDEVRSRIGIPELGGDALARFFQEDPSLIVDHEIPQAGSCRYLGNACMLLQWNGRNILTNPAIEDAAWMSLLPERLDAVLITRNDFGHVLLSTLIELRHRIGTIVVPPTWSGALDDPSLRLALLSIGFRNVVELSEFESVETPAGSFQSIPVRPPQGKILSKAAYMMRVGEQRILVGGNLFDFDPDLSRSIHPITGGVDAVLTATGNHGREFPSRETPGFTRPHGLRELGVRKVMLYTEPISHPVACGKSAQGDEPAGFPPCVGVELVHLIEGAWVAL